MIATQPNPSEYFTPSKIQTAAATATTGHGASSTPENGFVNSFRRDSFAAPGDRSHLHPSHEGLLPDARPSSAPPTHNQRDSSESHYDDDDDCPSDQRASRTPSAQDLDSASPGDFQRHSQSTDTSPSIRSSLRKKVGKVLRLHGTSRGNRGGHDDGGQLHQAGTDSHSVLLHQSSPRRELVASTSSASSLLQPQLSPLVDGHPMSRLSPSSLVSPGSGDFHAASDTMSIGSESSRRIPQAPGLVGIANHGNTCFMNAVVQCLSNTEPLCRYFTLDSYKLARTKRPRQMRRAPNDDPSKAIAVALTQPGAVTDQFALLLKSMWSQNYDQNVSLRFRQAVAAACRAYSSHTQQDAQEFLLWLLNTLDSDLKGNSRRTSSILIRRPSFSKKHSSRERAASQNWADSDKRHDSYIQNLFSGMAVSVLKCSCSAVSRTPDPFLCLSLPLPGKQGVRKVIVYIVYRSVARRPLQIGLLVPRVGESDDTVGYIIKKVCGKTGFPGSQLILCTINESSYGAYHLPHESVDAVGTVLYAFEAPAYIAAPSVPSATKPSQSVLTSLSGSLVGRGSVSGASLDNSVFGASPQVTSLLNTEPGLAVPLDGTNPQLPSLVEETSSPNSPSNSSVSPKDHTYLNVPANPSATVAVPDDYSPGNESMSLPSEADRVQESPELQTTVNLYENITNEDKGAYCPASESYALKRDPDSQNLRTHSDSDAPGRAPPSDNRSEFSHSEHDPAYGNIRSVSESEVSGVSAQGKANGQSEQVPLDQSVMSRDNPVHFTLLPRPQVTVTSTSPHLHSLEVEGRMVGGERESAADDQVTGSLSTSLINGTRNTHMSLSFGALDNGGPPRQPSPSLSTGPPTLPRSGISLRDLQSDSIDEGEKKVDDAERILASCSTDTPMAAEQLHYTNAGAIAVSGSDAAAEPDVRLREKSTGKRNPEPRPVSDMTLNKNYGTPKPALSSTVPEETILLLVLLVEGTAHGGTRFGSPMSLRVFCNMTYKKLHYLIVKSMLRYLGRPVTRSVHSLNMFRIRVQGGPPGKSYLCPDDEAPLMSETVTVALSSCPDTGLEKHIRLITEWTVEGRSTLRMLEEMPDVDRSVRDVEERIQKQERCTLHDCLRMFTQEEVLDDGTYNCQRCGKSRSKPVKTLCITSLPKILVIHIKRFEHIGKKHVKATTWVDFPVDLLEMEPFVDKSVLESAEISATAAKAPSHSRKATSTSDGKDKPQHINHLIRYVNIEAIETNSGMPSTKYKLIGTVNHTGTLHRGHYQSACRSVITDHWYHYDDSKVVPISPDEVVTRDTFLLFYQRLDLLQPVSPYNWIRQINTADLLLDKRRHMTASNTSLSSGTNGTDSSSEQKPWESHASPNSHGKGFLRRGLSPRSSKSSSMLRESSAVSMIPELVDALDVVAAGQMSAAVPPTSSSPTLSAVRRHHNEKHTETEL